MATEPQVLSSSPDESDLCAVFTRTVAQRRAYFIRTAQRFSFSNQDAEDIVQESVLRAFNHLSSFRGQAQMDTWLHAIVVNTARNWLRSRANRVFIPLDSDSYAEGERPAVDLPHPGKSPEESCNDRHLHLVLLNEIQSLDPMYRRPIEVCDLEQHSYQEAAAMLHLKTSTLKARLFRGRVTLKSRLGGIYSKQRGVR